MKPRGKLVSMAVVLISVLFMAHVGFAAYNHQGDTDSVNFRSAYSDRVGTKLDSCTTCHSGGSYTSGGKTTTLGSCQWCHYITNYGSAASPENLIQTLNPYGLAYQSAGRSTAALGLISGNDSDGDGFANLVEINALTYPGDANDDPNKVLAPSLVISLSELEEMPSHKQFLLMNASKSDDNYTQYSGVALENLVKAVMLDSATGITVYSPDGFATYHPFSSSSNPNSYHVLGIYPPGTFYYSAQADMATNPTTGWCNYTSPSAAGRENGTPIFNPEGLKMLLAFERDGEYLAPGVLNSQNKLDGEGPFRVVPPQKNPGPPDQRSTASNATDPNVWVWPYKSSADHNAGFSSRTVTMIRVEPLPAGTTDINTLEAGWPYVDEEKVVIYGSIDTYLLDRLNTNLDSLIDTIAATPNAAFKVKSSRTALVNKVEAIKKQISAGAYSAALTKLKQDFLKKTNGCLSGAVDANDWVKDLSVQKELCSQIQIIWVMLVLIGA
jgi:hypothetical protein